VLKGLNFVFERGKLYSIVGKNGCGKSTLVNLLTKLHLPNGGNILVKGTDLDIIPAPTWQKALAVAPQDHMEMHRFQVKDNIGIGNVALLEDDPDNLIAKEAEAFRIPEFVDIETFIGHCSPFNVPGSENQTWKGDFSAGQWQRIALARTFCRLY